MSGLIIGASDTDVTVVWKGMVSGGEIDHTTHGGNWPT